MLFSVSYKMVHLVSLHFDFTTNHDMKFFSYTNIFLMILDLNFLPVSESKHIYNTVTMIYLFMPGSWEMQHMGKGLWFSDPALSLLVFYLNIWCSHFHSRRKDGFSLNLYMLSNVPKCQNILDFLIIIIIITVVKNLIHIGNTFQIPGSLSIIIAEY